MSLMRIGMVVQRYGGDVVGGAETLARDVAERLNASGCDVTVFTTCARDYVTWANHYPEGEFILKGVKIKRFAVERERDIESFNRLSDTFFPQDPAERDEEKWIDEQGPYCPALIKGLEEACDSFDIFFFFTYLYYPTIYGMKAVGDTPVVLFPTAHDELPIYLNIMKDVFRRPDGLFFLTGAEMEFVKKTFSPPGRTALVRTGVQMHEEADETLFRRKHVQYAPFMLYAGRIEKGKGLEAVFDAYHGIKGQRLVDLVLMGKQLMDIPDVPGIKYVGFVPEEEKLSAFKGAVLSLQPSPLESLSITTLESFSQKTPVLVNHHCHVLREHIELSGGGLSYENPDQLIENFRTLYDNRKMRKQMGKKGYDYVKNYFSWDTVIKKIKAELERLVPR